MFSWARRNLVFAGFLAAPFCALSDGLPEGIDELGRPATETEVAAWDIDVRPDFDGLPPGQGNVIQGERIWMDKCASCHGDFGDSNEIFSPIVLGNITEEDIDAGRVSGLRDSAVTRTTLMKIPSVSTLWDYIYRAMPWNAPKSLSHDEVYALVAYILNLGYIVQDDFKLSEINIKEVQARMPNRNGMTDDHGFWSLNGKPDVQGSQCIKSCEVDTNVTSQLPDYVMNAHGNLAEQMRAYGPFPGLWTAPSVQPYSDTAGIETRAPLEYLRGAGCYGCHKMSGQLVGPGFEEIRAHYAGKLSADYLRAKILDGSTGVWGSIPMPAMSGLSDVEIDHIVDWLSGSDHN